MEYQMSKVVIQANSKSEIEEVNAHIADWASAGWEIGVRQWRHRIKSVTNDEPLLLLAKGKTSSGLTRCDHGRGGPMAEKTR